MTAQKRVLSLFAGIGGFDLGLERAGGFETVAFCEIDPFCRKVLAKHWPDVPCYEDVRELTSERLAADGIAVDVITGGFPCQDISIAGKRAGMAKGTRSGLWSECKRLVGELRPQFALFENVPNLLSGPSEQPGGWFATILSDLASLGFDAEWHYLPASFVGAWHRRGRVWILAYPEGIGGREGESAQSIFRQQYLSQQPSRVFEGWPGRSNLPAPVLCGAGHGVSNRSHRLKSLGNAVVPQIPELIGRAINETEQR